MAFHLINWSAPWLKPYKPIGIRLAEQIALGSPVHAALNHALVANPQIACPVRFVAPEKAQGVAAYESFIWQTKSVPTRNNLHDFFNGLMWLHFPKIKTRLNALQAAAIEAAGVTQHRGKLRDALTLFDENAAFLIEPNSPSSLLKAIQNKDWNAVFIQHRALWAQAQVVIFGHALLEKLTAPRKAITAHLFCPPAPMHAANDAAIAALLSSELMAAKPFTPLPVMGVPNWCAENADTAFYEDQQVFRPKNA
ncbi:MAG: DUF3025 domain-containing protein [Cytophagales bacterium]|nr:DUF3025 domain-containing protein [Cytophagales bacterium]